MLRLLVDENFDNDIVRGVLRRSMHVDLLRVQDIGLAGAEDPDVLAWAAQDNRILLTHDVATITSMRMNVYKQVYLCRVCSRYARLFPLVLQSKISRCLSNAACKMNGKDKFGTCH
jgi:hypothetical protein